MIVETRFGRQQTHPHGGYYVKHKSPYGGGVSLIKELNKKEAMKAAKGLPGATVHYYTASGKKAKDKKKVKPRSKGWFGSSRGSVFGKKKFWFQ
jgi:hypothetical protein